MLKDVLREDGAQPATGLPRAKGQGPGGRWQWGRRAEAGRTVAVAGGGRGERAVAVEEGAGHEEVRKRTHGRV